MLGLLTLLQSADGVRQEEPNIEYDGTWGFNLIADLSSLLWWCFKVPTRHMAVKGGLSFGTGEG